MVRLWLLIASVLITLLSLRFYFFYANQPELHDGQYLEFKTTLLSEPNMFSNYQQIIASPYGKEKIIIKIPRYPEFHYGQTLRISSTVHKQVLSNKKTVMAMYFPKVKAEKNDKNMGLAIVSTIRQRIISFFENTLPPDSSSLLLGIVFGIKEQMSKENFAQFRNAGVLHVIAASGMNVTMVGGFLSSFFTMFLRRQFALVLTILGICFYAVLAGLEPSIVRASIMGILVFCAQILGRQRLSVYSLFLAAFAMFFISPNLLFDVGFQLSFMATLGLILIPKIRPARHASQTLRGVAGGGIGEDLLTTISAQIATLPILLFSFGTYSLWSVVVNGLVLWVVPILMMLGGIGAILGLIIEPLGQVFLYLSLPFLLYFQEVISTFSRLGGLATIREFSWQLVVGYYCFLSAVLVFFYKGNNRSNN